MAAVTERVRSVLVRRALRLEWPTAAWMVIEAAVAIGSGIAAHSLSLVAFGVDSVIELASSGVLLWRLNVELRWGMDRASTWIDIALGLLIAGPLAAWLPKEFWQAFFLSADPLGSKIVGPLIGPIVAIVSFVCSVGNAPLAAVLWNGGISFGAVIAFLFADLIVLPILDIYRRYYGLKIALLLLGVSYAAMAGAAYIVELIFGVASAPTSRPQVSVTMWRLRPLTFLAAS